MGSAARFIPTVSSSQITGEDVTLEFSGVEMSVDVMEAALEERWETQRVKRGIFRQRLKKRLAVQFERGCSKSSPYPKNVSIRRKEAKATTNNLQFWKLFAHYYYYLFIYLLFFFYDIAVKHRRVLGN